MGQEEQQLIRTYQPNIYKLIYLSMRSHHNINKNNNKRIKRKQ